MRRVAPEAIWGTALACGAALLLGLGAPAERKSLFTDTSIQAWPKALLWAILLLSAALALNPVLSRKPRTVQPPEHSSSEPTSSRTTGRILLFVAIQVGYVLVIDPMGFAVAAFLFSLVATRVLGETRWWRSVAFSATMAALLWLLFVWALDMPLPKGLLGARS